MTQALKVINGWFSKKGAFLFPSLAFFVPLVIRFIPEILMGQYLVGFDPMGYYVPNTVIWLNSGVDIWQLMSSAPLIYLLLMGITSVGVPILISLKVLGPLLLGLLGFVVYRYANRALLWSSKKSLLVAMLSSLYFVALRISWDMFRSELGLILLFIALTFLQTSRHEKRNAVFMSLTMVLVVLSHQLIAVIMFAIIIAFLLRLSLKKEKADLIRVILSSLPATLLFISVLYINFFVYSSPVLGYSVNYSGGVDPLSNISHLEFIIHNLGFLAFCYLPLVPLLIFGVRRFRGDFAIKTWIVWLFLPILLAIISPTPLFIGGVLPYRWVLLLTYPLTFYAVEGISRIRWKWYSVPAGVAVGLILVVLSAGFISLPNDQAYSYFAGYPSYVPKSMLQNTIQLSDCQDTNNALVWAQNNLPRNGSLLVHEAFYGWALLTFDNNRIAPYFFGNLNSITETLQKNNSTAAMYLIWWVNGSGWYGQPNVPSTFMEIYHSGNIAIYHYLPASIS